jgi:hypothetical protein
MCPLIVAIGSTKHAAIDFGPYISTNLRRSSAKCAPCSGCPFENLFSSNQVCLKGITPGNAAVNTYLFLIIPLKDVPPIFTPW